MLRTEDDKGNSKPETLKSSSKGDQNQETTAERTSRQPLLTHSSQKRYHSYDR